MVKSLERQPLFLIVVGIFGLSMYVPAMYALSLDHFLPARTFFYAGTLTFMGVVLVGFALSQAGRAERPLDHLLAFALSLVLLPGLLAVPLQESIGDTTFVNAYFEMVSAITTTGATLFDAPERLSPSLHLWRAQVAWMGGLMTWIAAASFMAPLSLGGHEITARAAGTNYDENAIGTRMHETLPIKRVWRAIRDMAPIYAGLTLALWIGLIMAGDVPIVAAIHAMSTMSTSGISAIGGIENSASGRMGEVLIFAFLAFALSRRAFTSDRAGTEQHSLLKDPEFRIGMALVVGVPLLLFLRHWVGAFDVDDEDNLIAGFEALWGGLFTVMSFLTTTGFESGDWAAARGWSGLGTPGLILMGLSVIGGGVATTAGGVKLLRVFALYLSGLREMEKLVHPSSVASAATRSPAIRRRGAVIAWVFFMLFAMSLAAVSITFAALGSDFKEALILSVSALSTTGPLTQIAGEFAIDLASLGSWSKTVFCAAMVLGRLETLALIALFSRELWRN